MNIWAQDRGHRHEGESPKKMKKAFIFIEKDPLNAYVVAATLIQEKEFTDIVLVCKEPGSRVVNKDSTEEVLKKRRQKDPFEFSRIVKSILEKKHKDVNINILELNLENPGTTFIQMELSSSTLTNPKGVEEVTVNCIDSVDKVRFAAQKFFEERYANITFAYFFPEENLLWLEERGCFGDDVKFFGSPVWDIDKKIALSINELANLHLFGQYNRDRLAKEGAELQFTEVIEPFIRGIEGVTSFGKNVLFSKRCNRLDNDDSGPFIWADYYIIIGFRLYFINIIEKETPSSKFHNIEKGLKMLLEAKQVGGKTAKVIYLSTANEYLSSLEQEIGSMADDIVHIKNNNDLLWSLKHIRRSFL